MPIVMCAKCGARAESQWGGIGLRIPAGSLACADNPKGMLLECAEMQKAIMAAKTRARTIPSKAIALGVAVALIAHEGARTYFDPGDTTRDAIPLAAVPVSSAADTGAYSFMTDAITDLEFSKPVPERPTLTIKSS